MKFQCYKTLGFCEVSKYFVDFQFCFRYFQKMTPKFWFHSYRFKISKFWTWQWQRFKNSISQLPSLNVILPNVVAPLSKVLFFLVFKFWEYTVKCFTIVINGLVQQARAAVFKVRYLWARFATYKLFYNSNYCNGILSHSVFHCLLLPI